MADTVTRDNATKPAKGRDTPSTSASARHYSIPLGLALIAPLLLLLILGFVYPIGRLLLGSFFDPEFTLRHYARIVEEPLYLRILWRTVQIAFIVTALALLLGFPVALAMARVKGRLAMLVAALVLIPLWTSILVRSYAWIALLQRNGIINDALVGVGIVSDPLRLLYTEGAVIVAMAHVLLPFMILPLYSSLRAIPDDLIRAAFNMGAGRWSVLVRVIVPLSLPGVYAGALLTFILSLGFFITPALVGGPETLMIATLISQQTTETLNWKFAGALSTVLLVTSLMLAIVFRRVIAFNKGYAGGH